MAFSSEQDLERHLTESGIDVSNWGTGKAKTVAHLLKEIQDEETVLTNEDGTLFRDTRVATAQIVHGNQVLREEKQVFTDGRERNRDLPQSISEKFKANEDPTEAIERGIREELQIEGDLDVESLGEKQEVLESPSYPTLQTRYLIYEHLVKLSEDQFIPEGYTEEQDDKTTYFAWQESEE